MLILFDHCTPRNLRRHLSGHVIHTADELGWSTLRNGLLIARAESAGYELLITADQDIAYQQNLADRTIPLLVLTSNRWPLIRLHIQTIIDAIDSIGTGGYAVVEIRPITPEKGPGE